MLSRHRVVVLLAALAGAATHGPACAQGRLDMHARVLPLAAVEVREAPATFQVSSADVQRGYVQLTAPILLSVRTNLPAGVSLEITSAMQYVVRMEVLQADGARRTAAGIDVPTGASVTRVMLRVHLDPRTLPGVYALPVKVATIA